LRRAERQHFGLLNPIQIGRTKSTQWPPSMTLPNGSNFVLIDLTVNRKEKLLSQKSFSS
jgi:hypothetical protein